MIYILVAVCFPINSYGKNPYKFAGNFAYFLSSHVPNEILSCRFRYEKHLFNSFLNRLKSKVITVKIFLQ